MELSLTPAQMGLRTCRACLWGEEEGHPEGTVWGCTQRSHGPAFCDRAQSPEGQSHDPGAVFWGRCWPLGGPGVQELRARPRHRPLSRLMKGRCVPTDRSLLGASKSYMEEPSLKYVCVCVYMCTCVCVYVSVYMCTCVHVYAVHVCMCNALCVYICMRVHMYTCICVCKHIYVHVCTCACVHMYTCVCVYVCYVCTCVCVHMRIYVCVYMCTHVYVCACMHVCMRVYVYVCICVCVYVFIFSMCSVQRK